MKISKFLVLGFCVFTISLLVGEVSSFPKKDKAISQLSRADTFPKDSIDGTSDAYFEGYLQSLVDMHYYEYKVIVLVNNHRVWLANLPKNKLIANSIIEFLKDVPGVNEVKVINGVPPEEMAKREKYVNRPKVSGIWFPQNTELFLPIIADPRQAIYSAGYRGGDKVCGKNSVAISLGDDFPIFRWLDVFPCRGDMQFGVEGGIWSVFNMDPHPNINGGTELVNTDFYVGLLLTYAVNKWSFRFRGYHVSGHVGDEYMVNHPGFVRKNPSLEAIDFFMSYQVNSGIRLILGPGVVVRSDKSFHIDPLYVEYGPEFRFWGHKSEYHRLYGTFFLSAFWKNSQELKWDFDGTYVFGYELSKLQGIGRKMRIMAEYHHGFSEEGQFAKERTQYGGVKFSYGF
jgi:hypothetical protein